MKYKSKSKSYPRLQAIMSKGGFTGLGAGQKMPCKHPHYGVEGYQLKCTYITVSKSE